MEILTIILSSFLAAVSPAGIIIDSVSENALSQRSKFEQLAVRIDNVPSYQILAGKVERVRLASRGVEPIPDFRIEAIEIETDPIDVDLSRLRQEGRQAWQESLEQPLQGGIRMVLTEDDLNRALQSPRILSRLQQSFEGIFPSGARRYELLNPGLEFVGGNRLRLQAQLKRSSLTSSIPAQTLDISLETGIEIVNGRRIRLIEPEGTINERPISQRLLKGFAQGVGDRFDLRDLEKTGVTARLLQLEIDDRQLQVAAFVRLEAE